MHIILLFSRILLTCAFSFVVFFLVPYFLLTFTYSDVVDIAIVFEHKGFRGEDVSFPFTVVIVAFLSIACWTPGFFHQFFSHLFCAPRD